MVSPAHAVPPTLTGPLVVATDTDPVMVAWQNVIANAPEELSDPPIVPPLTYKAPPLATETDPVTLPPVLTQMA
jgi:hypothetical protein